MIDNKINTIKVNTLVQTIISNINETETSSEIRIQNKKWKKHWSEQSYLKSHGGYTSHSINDE